jgi:hypothetical protein
MPNAAEYTRPLKIPCLENQIESEPKRLRSVERSFGKPDVSVNRRNIAPTTEVKFKFAEVSESGLV